MVVHLLDENLLSADWTGSAVFIINERIGGSSFGSDLWRRIKQTLIQVIVHLAFFDFGFAHGTLGQFFWVSWWWF